jgi:xanthine dehydrogenase accessory factor
VNDWLSAAWQLLDSEPALVRVTVIAARGSVPRDIGTTMLVTQQSEWGTIGGGHLEWNAQKIARELLGQSEARPGLAPGSRRDRFALGASLGQCCGGAVEIAFERLGRSDRDFLAGGLGLRSQPGALVLACRWDEGRCVERLWIGAHDATTPDSPARALGRALLAAHRGEPRARLLSTVAAVPSSREKPSARRDLWLERVDRIERPLWIFGAGHVARALVPILATLPVDIHWIDNREGAFPPLFVPSSTWRQTLSEEPADEVALAPAGTLFLVMTHNHELDYAICRRIMERGDFGQLGLIGSETKARRFNQRLAEHGIETACLARLVSPIGIRGIESKLPAAIAVSVAAQILQWLESAAAPMGRSDFLSVANRETQA